MTPLTPKSQPIAGPVMPAGGAGCLEVRVSTVRLHEPSLRSDQRTRANTSADTALIAACLAKLADLAAKRASIAAEEAKIIGEIAEAARNHEIQLAELTLQSDVSGVPTASPFAATSDAGPNTPTLPAPLFSVRDIAATVKADEKTVRRWRRQGRLPKALEIGGLVRWRREDIEAWIASEFDDDAGEEEAG